MFERSLEEEKIRFRALEFSSINSLRLCLQENLGLTICPAVSISRELKEGLLVALNWQEPETSVIMIRHLDKWCSPILKRFMDIAEQLIPLTEQ